MILGFKQKFPSGEPTYFREKILASAGYFYGQWWFPQGKDKPVEKGPWMPMKGPSLHKPKLHTIREDLHNRWKAGMSIQMVYRGPHYSIEDHFNEGIPELEECKSVQTISIKWFEVRPNPMTAEDILKMGSWTSSKQVKITVDGENINFEQMQMIAFNDGFPSLTEFLMWFNKDFSGKILHWTDLKY